MEELAGPEGLMSGAAAHDQCAAEARGRLCVVTVGRTQDTMWRPVVTAVLVVAAVIGGAAGAVKKPPRGRQVVAQQQTRFGMQLYSVLAQDDRTENILFSPLSIGTAMAIVYAGSRGETAQQLERVIGFPGSRKVTARGHRGLLRWMQKRYRNGDVTVKMTNRIYPSAALRMRPIFKQRVSRLYQARLKQLDFGQPEVAAGVINSNVETDTAGHITSLMDPSMLDGNTAMVLVNAVYFKGAWLIQFDPSRTTQADFHAPSGTKSVPMMRAKKYFPVGNAGALDSRILKLPYKGEDISMLIVLPNERDGIHELDSKIGSDDFNLDDFTWTLDSDEEVEVQLPKFKMEDKTDLKEVLKKMGLTDIFDANLANLSGIASGQEIFVSDAIHKAAIEVSEEGTTATAATAVGFSFRMLKPKPEPFIVDRPFFFVLRDERTGATLFVGRVMEP